MAQTSILTEGQFPSTEHGQLLPTAAVEPLESMLLILYPNMESPGTSALQHPIHIPSRTCGPPPKCTVQASPRASLQFAPIGALSLANHQSGHIYYS